jgi:hypothetical protein
MAEPTPVSAPLPPEATEVVTERVTRASTVDPEFKAMIKIQAALEDLSSTQQGRVLSYLSQRVPREYSVPSPAQVAASPAVQRSVVESTTAARLAAESF